MVENKFLDDIAKFGNSTINAMSGMQRQVRTWVTEQIGEYINGMDFVKRSELDVYKELSQKSLAKVDELEKRIAKLEGPAVGKPKAATAKPKATK